LEVEARRELTRAISTQCWKQDDLKNSEGGVEWSEERF
jgi:hypothetical protein